ncbi:MAG: Asp23/Gls24 family envelope stress response protein [Oscillospiraceae bacterium]|nr:Asp23/Gls24 family envelope stress response protein [Oscillospiraceae bacterium]
MMRLNTEKGLVTISTNVFTNIAGMAATNCFGVKGMAVRSRTDGLVHLLRREAMDKGVLVTYNEDETVSIDLHVMMDHGINIAAVAPAIINQVSYVVTKTTGVSVKDVNVYIDSISVD